MTKTTELARASLPGSPSAGEARVELFERILARLHRYFVRLVGPGADECVQETLLELQRSLEELKYRPGHSFNSWTFLKAHKVFVAWCRARERERRPPPLELARASEGPERAADRRLDAAWVLTELARQLGPETYETFVLRHEGGLGLAELALVSDCDRRTISRRLERAHALIAELLSEARPPKGRGEAPRRFEERAPTPRLGGGRASDDSLGDEGRSA